MAVEVEAVAYWKVALALEAFAGEVLGAVVAALTENSVDSLVVDRLQEEMDGDQVAAEEPPMAPNLEEAVYVLLEKMHQKALPLQFLGWFPRSVSAQEQMLQESAAPQVLGNYLAGGYQMLDFVHHSLGSAY